MAAGLVYQLPLRGTADILQLQVRLAEKTTVGQKCLLECQNLCVGLASLGKERLARLFLCIIIKLLLI